MSLGIGMMIGGGLFALLGVLLLFNHNGIGKIIGGIVMAVVGLGCLGVGYSLDQKTEITYTVTEITAVSARDDNNEYRLTLKPENGAETWIYVNDNQLILFPKGEQVTLTKREVKAYREQTTG